MTGAVGGEVAVALCARYTDMAWLWWNVIGCVVSVAAALVIHLLTQTGRTAGQAPAARAD